MAGALYSRLAWLPRAPDDFAVQVRALRAAAGSAGVRDAGARLRALADCALDEDQLQQLAKAIGVLRASGAALEPLVPFKLGLISNATTNFMVPALIASAIRHGVSLDVVAGDYGQFMQAALDADSPIHAAKPDAVLLALDYRAWPLSCAPGDVEAERSSVQAALTQLDAMRAGIGRHCGAPCIVQTLAAPPESLSGSFEAVLPGTTRRIVRAINQALSERMEGTSDVVLDVAALAETVGLANWHDPTLWNLAKLPFASDYLPLFADFASRVLAAMRGKSRRVLVLDLDNTLWGGVIGDDGLAGIAIAQGDAVGEAHLSVQKTALALRERGVVLAVSSKNSDEIARTPFREHPEMLLREEHIAVFQANWSDKATNIRAIARELALGLESFTFLDDNPVERAFVRRTLPQVAVPELPEDPALYARTLLAGGYYEAVAFSHEDRQRARFYEDNARRAALQASAGDIQAYLKSLQMVLTISPFDAAGRARIAQLINKSNQFNLTTRRYTEAEVQAAEREPLAYTLQVRLKDSFGDNGMISVVIARRAHAADVVWDIDTWLMSCRVLGRCVENAVLQELLTQARVCGIATLRGTYLPTARNKLVEDHYAKLGFELLERREDGATLWSLDVRRAPEQVLPMQIRRLGFVD